MARGRFILTEYDPPVHLVSEIARGTGLPPPRIAEGLQSAGDRAARALRIDSTLLHIAGQRVRATDFAGLLRVAPAIELEVAPKFLGGGDPGWREDFFFLAMLSRHGRLLSSDRLRAVSSENSDLATLVGRALVQMFWDNHRRPIRGYRRRVERDFAVEGDIEAEDLRLPDEDGFRQTVIRYDQVNVFNAAIAGACAHLIPEVGDPDLRASLQRISQHLGRQAPLRDLRPKRLPSRSRSWRSTYELGLDVLGGFGLAYQWGSALAPGFVLSTWQVWEDLVTISLRSSLGGRSVAAQKGIQLGHRLRGPESGWSVQRSLVVTPDLRIDGASAGFGDLLVDAKYKGRWHQGRQRIVEADIYEAMAFAKAAKAGRIVLVYPRSAGATSTQLGSAAAFERIDIEGLSIWGVEVEVRGISGRAGLRTFAAGLTKALGAVASA